MFTREDGFLSARVEAQQRSRMVSRAQGGLRAARARTDDRSARTIGGRSAVRSRPSSSPIRRSRSFAPIAIRRFSSDKSPIKTARRRTLSLAPVRTRRGGRTVFRGRARLGLDRRRDVHAIVRRSHAIREEIASSHPRLHRLVTSPAFKRAVGEMTGERLTRVPRGYVKDHPAAHYLQFKQFLGAGEYEASLRDEPGVSIGSCCGSSRP